MLLAAALLVGCGDSADGASDDDGVAITTSPTTTQVMSTASSTSGRSPVLGSAAPVYLPPFISEAAWAQTDQGPSLQVFPTESGRYTPGGSELDAAWSEVVAMDLTADTPGMRDQFACHWRFARIVAPEKTSWNLEPWRPVVSEAQMIAAQCNPGAPEEQIP